ncbi:Guanine nucleotide-binding protein subunit gamma [Fasciolopsis buskii]|uniref:Guanine nucleotide-binding protein subunit gamma n=1 Tax=Fasciolopsis buskii TaxID=27845 RepID=A0A8E0S0E6_9TREM|nr:Guanine nucleotide-binding protein subunit gamma [Fasciolopsis buski]
MEFCGEVQPVDQHQVEMEHKRMDIECLKRNLEISRLPLSKTIEAISNHCFENAQSDPLLAPPRDNPYKVKRSCTVF